MQALQRAQTVRLERAAWQIRVRAMTPQQGAREVARLLRDNTELDGNLGGLRVMQALTSVKSVGDVKAGEILRGAGLFATQRRLSGLTPRERDVLALSVVERLRR